MRRKELHCARVYKPEIKGTPRRREFIDPKYCQHLRLPKMRRTQKPCKTTCKWSVSNWSQCPSDCSGDYQSRSVYCESVDGNLINQTYCEDTKRPISRKICHHCIQREYKFLTNVSHFVHSSIPTIAVILAVTIVCLILMFYLNIVCFKN